jgi:hypothetical protein
LLYKALFLVVNNQKKSIMKTSKLLPLLLIVACMVSSFSGDVKPYTNGNKWIPTDFDTRNSVLLVLNFSIKENPNAYLKKAQDKATNEMKEIMKADYPYKYEFVSKDDLKSGKYDDKEKYRFALVDQNTYTQTIGAGAGGSSSNVFHIYDRKNDKHYPDTGHPSAGVDITFKGTVTTIVKYLRDLKPEAKEGGH